MSQPVSFDDYQPAQAQQPIQPKAKQSGPPADPGVNVAPPAYEQPPAPELLELHPVNAYQPPGTEQPAVASMQQPQAVQGGYQQPQAVQGGYQQPQAVNQQMAYAPQPNQQMTYAPQPQAVNQQMTYAPQPQGQVQPQGSYHHPNECVGTPMPEGFSRTGPAVVSSSQPNLMVSPCPVCNTQLQYPVGSVQVQCPGGHIATVGQPVMSLQEKQARCQHHFVSQYNIVGLFLAIFLFPIGIICCLFMKDTYCTNCTLKQ